ncbi:DUF2726 domain-containing protein [Roseinatronobacter bogoriensis]|uniref:DUF2726 domain-containing protein n=1 Tax=Roseinatronobacter bogoriensis TaxID=119542 RepID=UPI0012FE7D86|nr:MULTISPECIES: DUF2726 domain-containing protein [Rhodobaca]MBB4207108.1 hypothetical protein [Rhodobaca bogoriensis DSM 18756]
MYLLVFIRNLLDHLAEKILLLQPLNFGGITGALWTIFLSCFFTNLVGLIQPWLIAALVIPLVLVTVIDVLLRRKRRRRREPSRRNMRDPKLQLDSVAQVGFVKTQLMNKGENRVFELLERTVARTNFGGRVMAQVCLGEFVAPDPEADAARREEAFVSINSKRVDFLIIDENGEAVLAVEVQGSGHYIGKTAFMRDAVKKEALRRAGIPLVEVVPNMRPEEVEAQVIRYLDTTLQSLEPTSHQNSGRKPAAP